MKALHGWQSVHDAVLVGFAALVALSEGPAQVACILLLGLGWRTERLPRPGADPFALAVLIWGVSGYVTLGPDDLFSRSSGELTRPLMALAAWVGATSLGKSHSAVLARAAWAFGLAITLNAAYGVLQARFGPFSWDGWLTAYPTSPQVFIPGRVFHERAASGLFYHRLRLAHVGLVGLALCATVAASGEVGVRTRCAAAAGAATLVAALLLTYARAAWVGLALGTVVLLVLLGRSRIGVLIAGLGSVGAFLLLFTPQGARRLTTWPEDWAIRRRMFDAALDVFSAHPWFGVGHGGYRAAVDGTPDLFGVHLTSPHNVLLQALAETGLIGAAALSVAWGLTAVRLGRRVCLGRAEATASARLDRIALVGFVALSVTGVVHFTLHHAIVGLVFWTLAGVAHRR